MIPQVSLRLPCHTPSLLGKHPWQLSQRCGTVCLPPSDLSVHAKCHFCAGNAFAVYRVCCGVPENFFLLEGIHTCPVLDCRCHTRFGDDLRCCCRQQPVQHGIVGKLCVVLLLCSRHGVGTFHVLIRVLSTSTLCTCSSCDRGRMRSVWQMPRCLSSARGCHFCLLGNIKTSTGPSRGSCQRNERFQSMRLRDHGFVS